MMSNRELEEIAQRAEYKKDAWFKTHPKSQIPPTEGVDTLRLVEELRHIRKNSQRIFFDIADGSISLN
jgi:hypothetical protein